ncbi:sulfite exporter TauE/SafE family protein [archaeon]|jgi:cytochrome c-type biogenesis protein|nr:sulfite exporter TauE/SafE family protein [archaeon]MBT4417387.1 sulfite exporter TauE/SafE family protein [archaeon]
MSFMELMSTSNIPILAAFFIGLMNAISPCPLAANITAIAYISKKIDNNKHTIIVGLLYTLGRMFTYVIIASLIIWFGLNTQITSLALQKYGDMIVGPFLIILGFIMLDIIKLKFFKKSEKFIKFKERLSTKGYFGSFMLGAILALAFCPFSAVLFFGMLIPLAISAGDGIVLPSVFAIATGLPVIIFSFILVYSINKLGTVMNYLKNIEKIVRKSTAIIIIVIGLYYVYKLFM